MKFNNSFLYLAVLMLSACSSGNTFTHVGSLSAGRDLSVKGYGSRVDLSRSTVSAGRDISLCGENGIRTPNKLYAPRDLSVIQGNCKSSKKSNNPDLQKKINDIKKKTDRLNIQERGGFTVIRPNSPSATVRMK